MNSSEIDWNCDSSISQSPVQYNINTRPGKSAGDDKFNRTVLRSFEDWPDLDFGSGVIGNGVAVFSDTAEFLPLSQELTKEMDDSLGPPLYGIEMQGGGILKAIPPTAFDQPFDQSITVRNSGLVTDTYTLTASSRQVWASFAAVPAQVTLAPGQSTSFSVRITLPKPLDPTVEEEIVVTAQSAEVSNLSDSAHLTIRNPQTIRPVRPVLECVADNGDGSSPPTLAIRTKIRSRCRCQLVAITNLHQHHRIVGNRPALGPVATSRPSAWCSMATISSGS